MSQPTIPGFRRVPRTGVIYVMHRARQAGFEYGDPAWANLGQGMPETGELPGAPPRVKQISIDPQSQEYGPITGEIALRQKVADLYNILFRQGKSSLYTWENVSIAGGGRVALTRLAAALGNINMGHFLPDYTAYEELLSVFKAFIPIPILLDQDEGYVAPLAMLKREILGRGLRALLVSNPCNPTGQLVEGERLRRWVQMARDFQCSLILDEFYSHYIYTGPANAHPPTMVSAAAYVEDVNADPVIIIDGLTKNWRYPGWRISWTLGPKEVIGAIASAGSFLDGGPNHPFQNQVLDLLEPELVYQETQAIQDTFRKKRDYTLARLRAMGIGVEDREVHGARPLELIVWCVVFCDDLQYVGIAGVDQASSLEMLIWQHEIIEYLERKGEISKDYAETLRKQLREKGVRSFGPLKKPGYYLRRYYYGVEE